MHRLLPLLLLLVAACRDDTPAPPQTSPPAAVTPVANTPAPEPPANTGPPVIDFETTSIDFGVVPEIEKRATTVRFTNRGGSELVIEAVKTDCGCTAAEPRKRRYEPGESGILDVEFDPSGSGEQNKKITIFTNAGQVVINVRANVKPFAELDPSILRVGSIALGRPHRFEMTLECADPGYEIGAVTATNPHLSVRALPHEAGRPATIEILVKGTAEWGSLFSWVAVEVTARPSADAEPVTNTARGRLQGAVFGRIAAEPDTFRYGVTVDEAFTRTIKLNDTTGRPFEVIFADAYLDDLPGVTLEKKQVAPDRWELILSASGAAMPGPSRGRIVIETNVPGEEQLVIRAVGVTRDQYGR